MFIVDNHISSSLKSISTKSKILLVLFNVLFIFLFYGVINYQYYEFIFYQVLTKKLLSFLIIFWSIFMIPMYYLLLCKKLIQNIAKILTIIHFLLIFVIKIPITHLMSKFFVFNNLLLFISVILIVYNI